MFIDPKEENYDLSSYPEYKTREGWKEYKDPLTSAIIFAAKKLDGAYIPGTQVPYIMVALKNLLDLNRCESKYHQLAAILSIFPTYGRTTYREIEDIFGINVSNMIYLDHKEKKPYEIISYWKTFAFYKEEDWDDWNESKLPDFWRPEEISMKLFTDVALLGVLAKLRKEHDKEFIKNNPRPTMLIWNGADEWADCDNCKGCKQPMMFNGREITYDGSPAYDYDAERENWIREDYHLWYLTSGYTNVKFACFKDMYDEAELRRKEEEEAEFIEMTEEQMEYSYNMCDLEDDLIRFRFDIGEAQYEYTTEYKEYCDRCSREFWQRFNLTPEEAQKTIGKYFPWIDGNQFNDCIYYLIVDVNTIAD